MTTPENPTRRMTEMIYRYDTTITCGTNHHPKQTNNTSLISAALAAPTTPYRGRRKILQQIFTTITTPKILVCVTCLSQAFKNAPTRKLINENVKFDKKNK